MNISQALLILYMLYEYEYGYEGFLPTVSQHMATIILRLFFFLENVKKNKKNVINGRKLTNISNTVKSTTKHNKMV